MRFIENTNPSNSRFIAHIWHSQSDQTFPFISYAGSHSEIVIAKQADGNVTVTVRGPETHASLANVQANSEYIGIVFKQGTYIPSLLPKNLMNRRDADLSLLNRNTFLLDNQHWEIPTFENADTFIARLVQKKLLAHDAEVSALLQDQPGTLSSRAAQYRFIRATGLSYAAIRQIEKARAATTLIAKGKSALEVIHELGYYDQSHLIRSLKRYIGHTPTELARAHWIGSLLTPAAITPAVKSY